MRPILFPLLILMLCVVPARAQDLPRVAFGAEGGIYTAYEDGSGRELLTVTLVQPSSVVWSPDGTRIAYIMLGDARQHDLFVYDAVSGETRRVTDTPAEELHPTWSPDGEQIAYAGSAAGSYDIWVTDADGGGEPRRLTADDADDRSPSWSPDGVQIAFASSRDSQDAAVHQVYVMQADGTQARRLTFERDQDVSAVAWSPDGTRLAYRNGGVDDIGEIEWILPDGSGRTSIARGDIGYTLAWSPGGARLVYGCFFQRVYQQCVIHADCGGSIPACMPTRRRYNFGSVTLFSWQP